MTTLRKYLESMKDKSVKVVVEDKKGDALIYSDIDTILSSSAKYLDKAITAKTVDANNNLATLTIDA